MLSPENPVLRKELFLRLRLRQTKPVIVGIFALVLLSLGYLHYLALNALLREKDHFAGQFVYQATFGIQFLLMGLIAPALTASAVSQEKEQQTWEMLLVSRLTTGEILWGKFLARIAPLGVLLLLGMPLASIGWEYARTGSAQTDWAGGAARLSSAQFWLNYTALIAMGVFFAAFAFYLSLRLKRTLYAMLGSYAFVVGFLTIGTVLVSGTLQMLLSPHDGRFMERCPLTWINPIYQLAGLVTFDKNNYLSALAGAAFYAAAAVFFLRLAFVRFQRYAYER